MTDAKRGPAGQLSTRLLWALGAWVLLLLFNAVFTPGFFDIEWRQGRLYGVPADILNHGSRIAIVALGMTLVIASGGIDLSVGSVAAIAGALVAVLSSQHGTPWPPAIAAGIGAGCAAGLLNALLVTRLGLQPIVATLVLMVTGRGIAQLIAGGVVVEAPDPALAYLGNGAVLGLPVTFVLLAAAFAGVWAGSRRTAFGLFLSAVGAGRTASRYAGVPDRIVLAIAYTACGAGAALAGIIEMSYIRAADSNSTGQLMELDAILAVVIGGTSLQGGRFSLAGSIVGALLMQSLTTTLYMQDVSSDIAPAVKAVAVLLVCVLQSPRLARKWAAQREARRSNRPLRTVPPGASP